MVVANWKQLITVGITGAQKVAFLALWLFPTQWHYCVFILYTYWSSVLYVILSVLVIVFSNIGLEFYVELIVVFGNKNNAFGLLHSNFPFNAQIPPKVNSGGAGNLSNNNNTVLCEHQVSHSWIDQKKKFWSCNLSQSKMLLRWAAMCLLLVYTWILRTLLVTEKTAADILFLFPFYSGEEGNGRSCFCYFFQ